MEIKFSVYRYLLFMTRFTGRGFWYVFSTSISRCDLLQEWKFMTRRWKRSKSVEYPKFRYLFLSTMIWASLYNLDIEPFVGFIFGLYVGVLGVLSILLGLQKSVKLEGARKAICAQGPQAVLTLCPQKYSYLTFAWSCIAMTLFQLISDRFSFTRPHAEIIHAQSKSSNVS